MTPTNADWQRRVLDYFDARIFYTEGAGAPVAKKVTWIGDRDEAEITWSDTTVTVVSHMELTKVLTSAGGTGVGLGMEDWAHPLHRMPAPHHGTSFYAELNCMWCNKVFPNIGLLEAHEDDCGN